MNRADSLAKSMQESIQDYTIKLNKACNLVDYFITVGIEPSIALNQWLYNASIEELNSVYKEYLSPKIINKFPSFDKKYIKFDETIIPHLFPLGYEIIESKNGPPKDEIFSVILDNNAYSDTYNYKFVVCLRFYEPLSNYRKIYEKYNDINLSNPDFNNYKNRKNSLNSNFNDISHLSSLNFNDNINNNNDKIYSLKTITKNNLRPNSFDLQIMNISQRETNISSIINNNNSNIKNISKIKSQNLDKYFIPKCICLISIYPFISELIIILKEIYQYSKLENLEVPLEKLINNLILEVPVPPRGKYLIEYTICEKTVLLQNSKINSLFHISLDFELLFSKFHINQILYIFQHLMLGIKIVFFSSEIQYLTPIIYSLLILLFPFKFTFPVVTVLPKELYNLIDNITPEIFGINEKYSPSFFSENKISISDYLLIVDIDKCELNQMNVNEENKLPSLPKKMKYNLLNKIKKYFLKIQNNLKIGKQEELKTFEMTVRNYFLEFQVDLLKNYNKYLNTNKYKHPGEHQFNSKKFLKSLDCDDREFYELFVKTQMFDDYTFHRMVPKDKKEMTEVLFFEEKILEAKGQKENLVYINSNAFDFQKNYKVPKVNNNMKDIIIEYYTNEQNHKKFLSEGIIINQNINFNINDISMVKSENSQIYYKPLFNYVLFPKLNNEFFFQNEIKTYYFNLSLYEEIRSLNSELILKSHLNRVVETPVNEIINSIYILWLKIWANSFHYHDQKEHKYRYLQMMKVFERINQHEMNVINHLFQALIKANANEDLIFHLYIKIIQCKLAPSLEIFNTIKTMISKQLKSTKISSSNDITKFLANKTKIIVTKEEVNIKNFRERTMKNLYDRFTITEKVTFVMDEICDNCNNKINIYDFQRNLNDTNNDNFWAKCPFCKFSYLPKIKIIFGSEINKNDKLKMSTSLLDPAVILYSPKTLHSNLIDNSNIDINNYKLKFTNIFWNLILYFKFCGLPYDFILPYSSNIFRPNKKEKQNFFNVKFSEVHDFNINKNIDENKTEKYHSLHIKEKPKNPEKIINKTSTIITSYNNYNHYNTAQFHKTNDIRNTNVTYHSKNNSNLSFTKIEPNLRTSFYNINNNSTQTLTPIKPAITKVTRFVNNSNISYNNNNYRIIIPSQKYKIILNKQIAHPSNNYSYFSPYNTLNNYVNYIPNNNIVYNPVNNYGMNNNGAYFINNKNTIIHRPTHYQQFITYN